eukprot:1296463-Rhodomonas_salina.4
MTNPCPFHPFSPRRICAPQVEKNGFQLHNTPEHARASAPSPMHEQRLVHAAADLERAAALEAAAGGMPDQAVKPEAEDEGVHFLREPVQAAPAPAPERREIAAVPAPKPDPQAAELVAKAKELLAEAQEKKEEVEAEAKEEEKKKAAKAHYEHKGPMSDKDSRLALKDYFEESEHKIEAAMPGHKQAKAEKKPHEDRWSAEAKKTMAEEAAEIESLQKQSLALELLCCALRATLSSLSDIQHYAAARSAPLQKQERVETYAASTASTETDASADGTLKKALFGNGGLKAAAASLARELMPAMQSRGGRNRGSQQQAYANIYQVERERDSVWVLSACGGKCPSGCGTALLVTSTGALYGSITGAFAPAACHSCTTPGPLATATP